MLAETNRCSDCPSDSTCPIEIFKSAIQNSPLEFNIQSLAQSAGLKQTNLGVRQEDTGNVKFFDYQCGKGKGTLEIKLVKNGYKAS